MSRCAKYRSYQLLDVISRMTPEDRQILLEFFNEEGVEVVTECIHNGLYNADIDREQRKAIKVNLKKDVDKYRCILKGGCRKKRREQLVQVGGGGLGLILQTVLPIIRETINNSQHESLPVDDHDPQVSLPAVSLS